MLSTLPRGVSRIQQCTAVTGVAAPALAPGCTSAAMLSSAEPLRAAICSGNTGDMRCCVFPMAYAAISTVVVEVWSAQPTSHVLVVHCTIVGS